MNLTLFYVVSRPEHLAELGIEECLPGIRYFMDYDGAVARRFGFAAARPDGQAIAVEGPVEAGVVSLDRALRCLRTVTMRDGQPPVIAALVEAIRGLAPHAGAASIDHAPVLVVERVLEPSLCRSLIAYYEGHGGGRRQGS